MTERESRRDISKRLISESVEVFKKKTVVLVCTVGMCKMWRDQLLLFSIELFKTVHYNCNCIVQVPQKKDSITSTTSRGSIATSTTTTAEPSEPPKQVATTITAKAESVNGKPNNVQCYKLGLIQKVGRSAVPLLLSSMMIHFFSRNVTFIKEEKKKEETAPFVAFLHFHNLTENECC